MIVGVVENGALYFVRTDHIGRPVFATDDAGVKVWEATYLPFGGVHSSTGPNPNLRFPGQRFQSETGLHQNWMRDYDPTTGRYMQADPFGLVDGASVYGYALQNPGRYVDPTGQAIPRYLGRAFFGAVSGGIGPYINSDGCCQAVVMALYLVLRAGFFPSPTSSSSMGTLLGGMSGSALGQLMASLLEACSCDGMSLPFNFEDAYNRSDVDWGLAVASGFGASFAGAGYRATGYTFGFGAKNNFRISGIEGVGAGAAVFGYGLVFK